MGVSSITQDRLAQGTYVMSFDSFRLWFFLKRCVKLEIKTYKTAILSAIL
jgi:hypothetical protein